MVESRERNMILVTGAAGFIGYHVSQHLAARGSEVIGLDDLNPYYSVELKQARVADLEGRYPSRFRFIHCDFSDPVALEQALAESEVEGIVHLGAQAGVRYSIVNPHAYVRSNLVGHLNMLELARQRDVPHFVYASSSSVYGGNPKLPFSVDDRVDHPLSLYAATKKADELMSETYSNLYRIAQTGLRFFTVYGPWGRPDMAMWIFTEAILKGESVKLFNGGDMRRDFTYIDDIVAGVIACYDRPPIDDGTVKAGGSTGPHRIYNIGNNRSEDLARLVGLLEAACGREAKIELRPMQPGDARETCADIEAIRSELGFEPRTSIDEGIPRFVRWYRDFHGL
jgi:UDP-glucuronate 4-epimerase